MTGITTSPPASAQRAAANRLRWWWSAQVGWPGLVALVCALVAATLAFGVRPYIEHERHALLQAQMLRLESATRAKARQTGPQVDPRDAWRAALPDWSQRGATIQALLALRVPLKLGMESAEYSADEAPPSLIRLRVDLPVNADYGKLRGLAAAVLDTFPYATIDAMEIARDADAAASLSGRLKLSFYFRSEAP